MTPPWFAAKNCDPSLICNEKLWPLLDLKLKTVTPPRFIVRNSEPSLIFNRKIKKKTSKNKKGNNFQRKILTHPCKPLSSGGVMLGLARPLCIYDVCFCLSWKFSMLKKCCLKIFSATIFSLVSNRECPILSPIGPLRGRQAHLGWFPYIYTQIKYFTSFSFG